MKTLGNAGVIGAFLFLHRGVLIVEDLSRVALRACVVDVRVRNKLGHVAAARSKGPNLDLTVARDLQDRQTAEGSHVLILLSDPLLQDIELDVTRLFGKLLKRHVVATIVVQCIEKSNEIATRGSQAGSGGKISD